MKAEWVILIDGGEVEVGCANCRHRPMVSEELPEVCGGCGAEMEDRTDLTMQYKKNEGWVFVDDKATT